MKIRDLGSAALIASTLACATTARAIPVGDDPIIFWNDQAQALLPGSTPVQSRAFAMVNIAMFDAVNAALGKPDRAYLAGVHISHGGDTRAAASQAAHDVLVALNPTNAALYDASLAASLNLVTDGSAKTHGIKTGAAYAAAILANRSADNSTAVVTYTTTGLPGDWRPTPPKNAAAATPQWGGVTPFLLSSGDQFRPGLPPALGSAEYAAAYNEVKDIGSATSVTRTADQTFSAKFWASGNASAAWTRIELAAAEAKGLSTLDNARAFALLAIAMADSQIAGFDSKYVYRLWRPITAIQLGDTDGNPLTIGDPAWTSVVNTPAFPTYISTHSTLSGSQALLSDALFGDVGPLCITLAAGNRCWDSFDAAALDASDSRIWGGFHFRFDTETGLTVGHEIGAFDLGSAAFSPVAEPAGYAALLGGLGLLGAALRRRRAAARAV